MSYNTNGCGAAIAPKISLAAKYKQGAQISSVAKYKMTPDLACGKVKSVRQVGKGPKTSRG